MVRATTARTRASAARARSIKINRRNAKKARAAIGRAGHTRNAEAREKCMMCLGKVSSMTRVTMGCVHEFHRRCLYRWLKYNTNCPVCRFNFMRAIPPEEPAEEQQMREEMTI
ncbi:hypothetical protein niasHS_009630 [Heterodera schachtii]|uniref:RING-type E3 ubiquitin transferase n=1 Tax=Heterodera schachtii TaxID=97005 RepID=A0ABD2JEA7_HETSC